MCFFIKYLEKPYFVKIDVLEARDYVDRVLDVHLFLFAKFSSIFERFMKILKTKIKKLFQQKTIKLYIPRPKYRQTTIKRATGLEVYRPRIPKK